MARKVGIEVEFIGNTTWVINALREAGLSRRSSMHSYEGHDDNEWIVKLDGSVSGGGELVSPPLDFDDEAQREQITKAIEVLLAQGCEPNDSTGIHVHVDCSDLDAKQIVSVVKNFYKFQDVLYRIASSGWERIRRGASSYAVPLQSDMVERIARARTMEEVMIAWYGDETRAQRYARYHGHESRYCGLNLHSFFYRKTIEFRIFNSSVNAERVQAYVALCVALVQDARNGNSRSIKTGCYQLGHMATAAEPERTAKNMFHRFLQVLRYEAGLSREDMGRLTKVWKDSVPQNRFAA